MQPAFTPSRYLGIKMRLSVLFVALLSGIAFPGCSSSQTPPPPPMREIAITFDDAPLMHLYSYPDMWSRKLVVDSLVTAARRHRVPMTLFTIGRDVEGPVGDTLMRYWLNFPVELANHTHTHRDLGTLPVAEGIADIERAQRAIAPYLNGRRMRYFRAPYLSEGRTLEDQQAYAAALRRLGLTNARVSISNQDWSYDQRYMEAELAQDWARRYEVGQEYLAHIREAVSYWERVGTEVAGRPVKHILLLHVNRVNRDYFGQILRELAADGWRFISLEEALRDSVYSHGGEFVTSAGRSWLEHVQHRPR